MTTLTVPDAIINKARAARAQAESLLAGLHAARAASEQRLAESSRLDPLKQVTGRSALENAIEATQHMLETLDRNLAELEQRAEPASAQSHETSDCVVVSEAKRASTVSA